MTGTHSHSSTQQMLWVTTVYPGSGWPDFLHRQSDIQVGTVSKNWKPALPGSSYWTNLLTYEAENSNHRLFCSQMCFWGRAQWAQFLSAPCRESHSYSQCLILAIRWALSWTTWMWLSRHLLASLYCGGWIWRRSNQRGRHGSGQFLNPWAQKLPYCYLPYTLVVKKSQI